MSSFVVHNITVLDRDTRLTTKTYDTWNEVRDNILQSLKCVYDHEDDDEHEHYDFELVTRKLTKPLHMGQSQLINVSDIFDLDFYEFIIIMNISQIEKFK